MKMVHGLLIVGWTGLSVGAVAAAVADIFPAHRSVLQHWGGTLLVGSVALMGLAVPFI
ncbi:MAG TPA: hypothetical protein VG328_17015 [Stellaceae bacterium]|nr:hypothetical protein [Stellaceae bacterium]